MISIKFKILAGSLVVSIVPLLIVGIMNVTKTTGILKHNVENQLSSSAKIKEAAIEEYVNYSKHLAKAVANTSAVQDYILNINNAAANDYHLEANNIIRSYQEATWGVYHHIYIADLTGKVRLSPPHGNSKLSHIGQDISHSPFFKKAFTETQVTDFFGFEESDHFHSILIQPVKSENQTVAFIIFELEIAHIQSILADNFEMGKTGIAFLATLEGTPIVKYKKDKRPRLETRGIQKAIQTGSAIGEFRNEKKTKVLGAYFKNATYPWITVMEFGASEAFAASKKVLFSAFLSLFITALLVFGAAYIFSDRINKPLKKAVAGLRDITEGKGDLTRRLKIESNDEVGELAKWFNKLIEHLQQIITQISRNAQAMAATSEQLSESYEEVNASTEQVNHTIQETARGTQSLSDNASIAKSETDHLMHSISEVAHSAKESSLGANEADKAALKGGEAAHAAGDKMKVLSESVSSSALLVEELGEKSLQINNVIEVINGISDQTNLLALNAAIEAARAGEAGRGFAVVADEIRKLAEESQKATKQIEVMIKEINTSIDKTVVSMQAGTREVADGMIVVDEALNSLELISLSMSQVAQQVQEINALSQEQLERSSRVEQSVNDVSAIAEQSAAASEEVSASVQETTASMQHVATSAHELAKTADDLKQLVRQFKID